MADNTDDTIITPPKVITGAIYEKPHNNGGTEQAQCIARLENGSGTYGLFRRFGLTFERFKDSSEEMAAWTLIWAPDGSHEKKSILPVAKKSIRRAKKSVENGN